MGTSSKSSGFNKAGPLDGVRVLDLSRLLPGPLVTQILGDFGADVIKVEDTRGGDGFRTAAPVVNGMSLRHVTLNRNKRCLSVDLKQPAGRDLFLRLACNADVILEQFRPGVMKRLGLDFDAVRAVNSRIVYCSLSGFGQDESPYQNLVAHDPNYLSLAGVLSLFGARGGPPALSGLQVADNTAALLTAVGILIALRRAESEGVGEYLDMALYDSMVGTAVTAAATWFGTGEAPSRGDERHTGRYPMADIYETADGGFVTLAAIEGHFWQNLCRALGHEEWIEHQYDEGEKAEEIRRELRAIFRTRTGDEWFAVLKKADVCIAPVLDIGTALESEQTRTRGLIVTHDHPTVGRTSVLATPIKLRDTPAEVRIPAGRLGEHSREILREIGLSDRDIAKLRADRTVVWPEDSKVTD